MASLQQVQFESALTSACASAACASAACASASSASASAYSDGSAFVKITRHNEVHNGLKMQDGLVVDPIRYHIFDENDKGGIYFCEERDVLSWIGLYCSDKEEAWIRAVEVPESAEVYQETRDAWKASKIILGPRMSFSKWCETNMKHNWFKTSFSDALQYLRNDEGKLLKVIPIELRTPELCEIAVRWSGLAMEFVPAEHQTIELCTIALEQDGLAIQFVPEHLMTTQLCQIAVQQNEYAIKYVPRQFLADCAVIEKALLQRPEAIEYIPEGLRTPEVWDIAWRSSRKYKEAVQQDWDALMCCAAFFCGCIVVKLL